MRLPILVLAIVAASTCAPAFAAAPAAEDAAWPCRQRLVPDLKSATFWSGPSLDNLSDWHGNKQVSALVTAVTPRSVETETGTAAIDKFARRLKPAERRSLLPVTFKGILAETNAERAQVIDRIKSLTRRQREVGALIEKVSAELRTIPETAEGPDADRRAEIVQRLGLMTRGFEETERTMRYACEVPVDLEARLGAYARALQSHL
jgi:hypothetical protein